jgi:hypothetical protein
MSDNGGLVERDVALEGCEISSGASGGRFGHFAKVLVAQ